MSLDKKVQVLTTSTQCVSLAMTHGLGDQFKVQASGPVRPTFEAQLNHLLSVSIT